MSDAVPHRANQPDFPQDQPNWQVILSWTCAVLMSIVFLVAGLWKATDPTGAAVRLAVAKVPQSLSVFAAVMFGIAETFTGILLLIPRFRRWGAWMASLLLISFIVFIGIHYQELAGSDCSCFPWLKRAVGPQFFIGDGIMLLLAVLAGLWARPAKTFGGSNVRNAAIILGAVAVFGLVSYGVSATRHTGTQAPETVAAEKGSPIPLREGKVFIYFFNPHCLHCLEAGHKLAALDWTGTRFVAVPTEDLDFADRFMEKSGLNAKGQLGIGVDALRKLFPFDLPPAGVALEQGYQKAMLLQFEDAEPAATLKKLGFAK